MIQIMLSFLGENFIFILSIITAVMVFFLGLIVFFTNPKNNAYRFFLALTSSAILWIIFAILFYRFEEASQILFAGRSAFAFGAFAALFMYGFTFYFPMKVRESINLTPQLSIAAILMFVFSYTPYVIKEVRISAENVQTTVFNFGLPLFVLFFLLTIGVSLYNLFSKKKYLSELQKLQTRFILIALAISSALAVLVSAVIPFIFPESQVNRLGPIMVSFFVMLSSYAILKYKLFDIKLIAAELLSFVISSIFFLRLFFSTGSVWVLNFVLFLFVLFSSIALVRGVMKDIADREHIEQLSNDLMVANEQLRQMDRQKSDFVSIASHQLRTPLTAIKGYASLLLENSFGEIPDQVRGAIGKIFESSQRMVMIVENFLTVSRIERGKMFYKFEVLDLQKITKDMVNDMRPVASGYGLEIRFREDGDRDYPVRADLMKLKQIVHNLLDESVRHTQKGFIDVSISFSQHADHILLTISDTGEGATPIKLKQMFERYEPDVSEGEIRKETGVELYIAREIVKAHRGKLWAESEGLGRGLTFFVELPALREIGDT